MRLRTLIIALLLLLITSNVGLCNNKHRIKYKSHKVIFKKCDISPELIKQWICVYAKKYKVEPAFAIAVAHIESRIGKFEFRTGQMSKSFWGPMGINKCFFKRGWQIDKPIINIEIGVRALKNVGNNEYLQKRRLHTYNTEFNYSYWSQIKKAKRKYREFNYAAVYKKG
jgi:hypothetical protein